MKRFAYYITYCTLVVLCACTHDDTNDVIPTGNGKITIQASLDDLAITRVLEDTPAERTIEYIDVFAVDDSDNIKYYERNTVGNSGGSQDNGAGVLTLNVARRTKINDNFVFEQDKEYKFYLVANAMASESDMGDIKTLAALEQLVQDNSFDPGLSDGNRQTLLHLSGTDQGKNEDGYETPETFLMDAVATDAESNSAWVVNPADDTLTNLNLSAEFKRAASKIIVNITQGEDVEFYTKLQTTGGVSSEVLEEAVYDFYKLPCNTFVLPSDENLVDIELVNTAPMGPNKETFVWGAEGPAASNSIKVIGYTYSHSWDNENLTNETSLILNIPMKWNKDNDENHTKEEAAPRSWYKVPLSKDKKFVRNKCYVVNVTINAVGASNRSTAIELEDIEYETLPWQEVGIDVGNEEYRPAYLELNTDLVEIYNANFDDTSLSFSSSSAITSVTLKDVYKQNADGTFTSDTDTYNAYYINKFGIKTSLSETITAMISATAQPDVLNGNIAILSPIISTTEAEREKALAALGEAPEEPTGVEAPSGMPEPELPSSTTSSSTKKEEVNDKDRTVTTTTTISYSYEGVGEDIKFYKTTTVNKTYKSGGGLGGGETNTVEGYPTTTTEEYVDETIKQNYITDYNTWVANNADSVAAYLQYLEAKARYDAYNTAKTAIETSGSAGETHYNTIRYLEFEVENEQGLTAIFRVMQYPVIYITNIQGWYSYRDDFGGTTYENKGENGIISADEFNNGTWTYSSDINSSVFWNSKVVNSYNENTGKSTIYCYYWDGNSVVSRSKGSNYTNQNAKLYHIRVTSSSSQYTVGRPRIVDDSGAITTDVEKGTTEAKAENNKLVSPSFMIASRLGFIWSGTLKSKEMAVSHCKQYVEVHKDSKTGETVTYRDWRLPTTAEIGIIISLQGAENENDDTKAIDFLLNATAYYSAEGPVSTSTQQIIETNDASVRCIRDAYENE